MNTVLTTTTAGIEQYALQRLTHLREKAKGYHAAALREAGGCTRPWAGMIEVSFDQVRAVGELGSLLLSLGDLDASRRISRAIDLLLEQLVDLTYQARMVAIPGWDHATQRFTHPTHAATPARTSH